ncbi:probable esterase KAI2 [Aristolochia californica]|uniref:probable esterase KAI2 n=1 Tax=Aristolochia californica TaxID=171875 RepID=UPI0035D83508
MVMIKSDLSLATNAKIVGSGDKILVLAHGFGADQSIWDKILPHLSQTHRVLVFDWNFSRPADDSKLFDDSVYSSFYAFADDLISLVENLNLKSFVFVGHSMSGMIGCIASIKRPELFQRLILVGASPRYLNSEDYVGGFERSDIDDILTSIESNFEAWALNFPSLVTDTNDPISTQKFGKSLQKMRPDIALSLAKTIFLGDYRDILDKVEAPCNIIQATNDIVVPVSVSHYMQQKLKSKASVEIIEADGHFPQLTAHELLIQILDRVLLMGSDIL